MQDSSNPQVGVVKALHEGSNCIASVLHAKHDRVHISPAFIWVLTAYILYEPDDGCRVRTLAPGSCRVVLRIVHICKFLTVEDSEVQWGLGLFFATVEEIL